MKKGKILCIDDIPGEAISSKRSLKDVIKEIFNSLPYKLIFATSGGEGLRAAKNDKDIKLVLLDITFIKQEMQGPQIADELYQINPQLKVIVLTSVEDSGKKRSFGWKANVVGYVLKKEIAAEGNRVLLKNLSESLINDPYNEKWTLKLDTDKRKVTLSKEGYNCSFSIPRSERQWLLLEGCANNPNKSVNAFDIEGYTDQEATYPEYVNKEVYGINEKVIKKTQWRTWGLLDTHCGEKSAAKLIVGKVEIDQEPIGSFKKSKKSFATLEQFEDLKKEFGSFKREITEKLEEIIKVKNNRK